MTIREANDSEKESLEKFSFSNDQKIKMSITTQSKKAFFFSDSTEIKNTDLLIKPRIDK